MDEGIAVDGVLVGVTAGRRAEQLAAALERRGAVTVVGSTVGGDDPAPEGVLAEATDAIIAADPDWLVASTGMGMGLWIDAAERTGHLAALEELAERARCVARGAKAVAGLRRLGADPEWVPDGQTDAEVVHRLADEADRGQTVAVQLHGSPTQHPYGRLRDRLRVLTITPYVSVLPEDVEPARRLIDRTTAGELDVVTFTSPSAVRGLFAIAEEDDPHGGDRLRAVLGGDVAVAAIGRVTAAALDHFGTAADIIPQRPRTGALIDAIDTWAASRPSG